MYILRKIKLRLHILICLGSLVLLGGCSGDNISLEEALLLAELDTVESNFQETGTEKNDKGSCGQVYVYVCGAVKEPGVYALSENCRIVAAIEAAGGFLEEAAREAVNLAAPVSDGMQITIPDRATAEADRKQAERTEKGLINLNQATVEELCTLSGIGDAKAEAILAYREEIGAFHSIEQIKNVSGIGENLFEQIKNSIYIE